MGPNRARHGKPAARFAFGGPGKPVAHQDRFSTHMGKLRNVPPLLRPVASRLGFAPGDERATDRRRNLLGAGRDLYRDPRWKRLRLECFLRDAYTCQRSGVICGGKYPAPDSPVANHKVPHRGNPALFFDLANLETVSKAVHDRLIQAEEQSIPGGHWD